MSPALHSIRPDPDHVVDVSRAKPMSAGDFFSAPGPYRDLTTKLCVSDPRLRHLDLRKAKQRNIYPSGPPVVLALRHLQDGSWAEPVEFIEAYVLREHLEATAGKDDQRWVYILEGLGPDFVRHLGEHFNLHPSIFVDQERVTVFDDHPTTGENDSTPLPSTLCTQDHITLKYYETLYMFPGPKCYRLYCAITGRQIAATRVRGKFADVGVVRRKCTFWSKTSANGNWNCLIMCDPPVQSVGAMDQPDRPFWKVKALPFQGGYRDFVPSADQVRARSGPPRTSMRDDLTFYLRTHSSLLPTLAHDPSAIRVFVTKLVACHYFRLADFLGSTFSACQRTYQRQLDFADDAKFGVAVAEGRWSDMQTWERRMGEYCTNVEAAMLQLRVPLAEFPNPSLVTSWTDVEIDYQALYLRIRELRHRAEGMAAAATGLTGIAGNRQACREQERSIIEAKTMKTLALLALIFFPLAYTASLLSMEERFLPGGQDFKMYFVLALPMILLVIISHFVLVRGYGDHTTAWSFGKLCENLSIMARRKKKEVGETA